MPSPRFVGWCETCQWSGSLRANNLTAAADYDRHMASNEHANAPRPPVQGDLLVIPFSDTLRAVIEVDGLTDTPNVYEVRDTQGDVWLVERAAAFDEHGHRAWQVV